MATKKQLTKNSWFIRNNTNAELTGVLFYNEDKYIFLSPKKKFEFDDLESVSKKLGKLKEVETEVVSEKDNINGFPVKHEDIKVISEDPPLYMRSNGKVKFIAGYCAINFEKGWILTFCPKYSTCEEYGFEGPFRNRIEAVNQVKILNTRKINDSF